MATEQEVGRVGFTDRATREPSLKSRPIGECPLREKDRLDRISLEQCFTTDPVERMVGEALTAAGFKWRHEGQRKGDPVRLDFEIVDGPYIEVKRFHTERSGPQLAQAENVILIQGIEAAKWFAQAIRK